jgi:maltose alpha-D-glucosyltransferase/alpha-amylase
VTAARPVTPAAGFDHEPEWYKDAVVYEVHVRAFADSDGDGIGDFDGLRGRLDYLQQLGVTCIWLLPFYPSPLRDDGYDIADYEGVHPDYGTLASFRRFLQAAHRRGLRVITELVLNHTSDQHPWFERARRAPAGSRWRDFYVWSDTPDRYRGARVIFQDFEHSNWSWDPVAGAYYWHRFYSHQPDLNFESPDVRRAVQRACDFWLDLGVDGLRLDAVPYLFEREGTSCENLPETHAFLRELREHVDKRYEGRMLLAEANQWPEDASAYFGTGDGDECHMAFHFPLMPRLFMGLRMEDRFPIVDILAQTPSTPPTAQWALFLRNHDELTLEMVTDEERDYMYRTYAHDPAMRVNLGIRRRLAPLLQNHRQKIELMHGLLLALPGTPFLYYGDEIGMGDNVYLGDRDSVRTPMQWSADRNAGFSRANPQRLYLPVVIDPEYHYETVNVDAQHHNPQSLLWWVRRLIALRRRYPVFARGELEPLQPDNPRVLAFLRRHGESTVLVVANLSRFAQYVELDLSRFRGATPVELFGNTPFPPIGELPYLLTLGPYAFYWLELSNPRDGTGTDGVVIPTLRAPGAWPTLFDGTNVRALEAVLPRLLRHRRWFGGKSRSITAVRVVDRIPLGGRADGAPDGVTAVLHVDYVEGESDEYLVPFSFAPDGESDWLTADHPEAVLARLETGAGPSGVLFDAHWDLGFAHALLQSLGRRRRVPSVHGALRPSLQRPGLAPTGDTHLLDPSVVSAEQSNTSLVFGDRYVLKTFRRFEAGTNPEVELGRALGLQEFPHVAPLIATLDYGRGQGASGTAAVLHGYVANEGDAWQHFTAAAGRYLEAAFADADDDDGPIAVPAAPWVHPGDEWPDVLEARSPGSLAQAELLGQRTAELHAALGRVAGPDFTPEPVTPLYQRSVYQSIRTSARRALATLRRRLRDLPPDVAARAEELLAREEELLARVRDITRVEGGRRIRLHGDLHLGQVLFTGRDFVFIDFEGEPVRAQSERRLKRTPLRDVAGMLRSFDYAARAETGALADRLGLPGADVQARWRASAASWSAWMATVYVRGYLDSIPPALLPGSLADVEVSLRALLLEKSVYELGYELSHRPDWVPVPLEGALDLLDGVRG